MMSKLIVSKTLSNLRDIDEKYYIGENSFQYVKKLTPENVAGIILDNNGYNINSQTKHFIKRIEGDPFKKVSGSAFCQRRQQLSHELFIKENEELVSNVYKQLSNLHNYNGKTLLAMDTSVITLPNHPLTKEKYGVKSKIDAKNIIPRARISCITDTLTNMIVSSEITVKATGEPKIAINQINNLENILDLSGCIFIGDRAYDTVPMIINIIEHDSHFILRLKKSTFKKERKNLIGDDENVLINMNKYRLKNVENPEMKEKYLKKGRLNLRIIRIPLEKSNNEDKEDEEYLITNLPRNIAPYEDFKELYHQRWTVETEFDRLKNIHEIENFQGRKELCIKQDFYAKILLYNITMALKQDAEKHMTRTISKNKKRRYQINISTALNLTKDILIDLLKTTNEFRDLLLENLIDEMTDDLSSSLTDPPSIERIIRDITNKFPGNIKRA